MKSNSFVYIQFKMDADVESNFIDIIQYKKKKMNCQWLCDIIDYK